MSPHHTPAPWEACGNLVRDTRDADGNGGFLIAECARFGDGGHEENRANARLVAAAPDLLAAACAAVAYDAAIATCGNDPDRMASFCTAEGDDLDSLYAAWIDAAHAAIAKAEGA